ncbi:MAG: hypothetical protein KGJ37_01305, partial [Verrucomicrobiota bacterium]|nr:hypothetical protein [Verrucomicrobiota bacterium]
MTPPAKAATTTASNGEDRRIWLIAGGGALLAAAVAGWLFPHLSVPAPVAHSLQPVPAVGIARLGGRTADTLVGEQAELFDPTPLFLPTRWNAKPRGLPASVEREPGAGFTTFPAELAFDETRLGLNFPASVKVP